VLKEKKKSRLKNYKSKNISNSLLKIVMEIYSGKKKTFKK